MSGKKRFARAPRRATHSLPSERLAMHERLHGDPRFQALKPRSKWVLSLAVEKHADGKGMWWTKVKTLAAEAGVSESTVKRALADADAATLIRREPYLRPDGLQGSSNYFLDPALVWPEAYRQGGADENQPAATGSSTPAEETTTRSLSPEPATRQLRREPAEPSRNEADARNVGVDVDPLQVGQLSDEDLNWHGTARFDELVARYVEPYVDDAEQRHTGRTDADEGGP